MTETNDVIAQQMNELYLLYQLQYQLQAIYDNLALISAGADGQTIVVNNVSLYALAAQYYGNADEWTTIAEANGLTDPMITDTTSLVIPNSGVDTGGILSM